MYESSLLFAARSAKFATVSLALLILAITSFVLVKPAKGSWATHSSRQWESYTFGRRVLESSETAVLIEATNLQEGMPQQKVPKSFRIVENTGPTIDVWYGLNQSFGQIGVPQKWVNILGNVADPDGIDALIYSLNGGAQKTLSVGPDDLRLEKAGDFNVDIDRAQLSAGLNQVVITATDSLSNVATDTVQVNFANNNVWSIPYAIDWSTVSNLQNVAQVVDGLWSASAGGLRIDIDGYDRLVAIGDVSWDDYEVKVPITIHSVDFSGDSAPGVGVLMRWGGHTDSPIICSQPKCGWVPNGNIGWWRFLSSSIVELHFNNPRVSQPFPSFSFETQYWLKIQVEESSYRLKVWEGQSEPSSWNLNVSETPDDQPTGSILLIAHYADATFGDVEVVPIGISPTQYTLTVTEDGNGSVSLTPQGGTYNAGTVVTLEPVADSSWTFDSWHGPDAGDLTDNTDGTWSITVDSNKAVTANFLEQYSLIVTESGNGSVAITPPGGTYSSGTEVTLEPTADSGYIFNGWTGSNAGDLIDNMDGTWSIMMNSDKAVTANFVEQPPEKYLLTVTETGDGNVALNPPGGIYDEGTVVTLEPKPEVGWAFDDWSGPDAVNLTDNSNGTWSIAMDNNKAVAAAFVELPPEQYTLSVVEVGNGNVELNPSGGVYTSGTEVMLTAVADQNCFFVGWDGDVSGTDNPTIITITSDASISAYFQEIKHLAFLPTLVNR